MQPGEAYLTRFSGTVAGPAGAMIDTAGTVGSILDVRHPARPPQGEHWIDEPQRLPVTAGEVGQVFGVVLDGASPPDVYLAATSAFGLHTVGGQWMPGMWGRGGPGVIWKLTAASGYRPQPLADVRLNGRPNTGAALGNMAFDKASRQIYVSDMETGMIHRIDAATGADLGVWDHGTMGRARFVDAATGQQGALQPIAFDPSTRARVNDCAAGPFDRTPACWNLAASGRRVWGVGVRAESGVPGRRLYYSVWSGPGAGSGWEALPEEEKRSAVWSVGLGPDGSFVSSDVRREFVVPDFFAEAKDVAQAGYSRPVSDITFAECSSKPVMLVSERGGHRNLGLGVPEAFAYPHEARTMRFEMDQAGNWQPVGRYDIGFYDRRKEGVPHMRANCAGGAAFGYGYNAEFTDIDRNAPGEFVWISGDSLCSPEGPCRMPGAPEGTPQPAGGPEAGADGSEVHGLQGLAEMSFDALAPNGAYAAYPQNGEPTPAAGPDQSWLIDADIDVDASGQPIEAEFTRNDATRIGDVAIYAICNPPPRPRAVDLLPVIPAAPRGVVTVIEGHDPVLTHATIASHGATSSHFRIASHNPYWSHDRLRSHGRWQSHDVVMSRPIHRPVGSYHRPAGSYHRPFGSIHYPRGSVHRPVGSIHRPLGSTHQPRGSIHLPKGSIHIPLGSANHSPIASRHRPEGSIHLPRGSANHSPIASRHRPEGSIHMPKGSTNHSTIASRHRPQGSIHMPKGSTGHSTIASRHRPEGSVHMPRGSTTHKTVASTHLQKGSVHRPAGSIQIKKIHRPVGSVQVNKVHRPIGSVTPHREIRREPPARVKSQVQRPRPVATKKIEPRRRLQNQNQPQ